MSNETKRTFETVLLGCIIGFMLGLWTSSDFRLSNVWAGGNPLPTAQEMLNLHSDVGSGEVEHEGHKLPTEVCGKEVRE